MVVETLSVQPTLANVLTSDVLVVGGGAAACMAAIAAHQAGARTLIVDKGQLGKSGCSPNAHGGMAIYHKDLSDSWRVHAEDTLMSGGFLNNQELVRLLCVEGPRFLERLSRSAVSSTAIRTEPRVCAGSAGTATGGQYSRAMKPATR